MTLVPVQVTPFVLNAQLYGALTQVFFLAFALGAKSYRLRIEYERIQQNYRADLERSVADRTKELEALNCKLAEHACNDTFGHGYGDNLLKQAASLLRSNTRPYDLLFRVGGDEFLIIMPETDPEEAAKIVERVRQGFESAFSLEAKISVSIGLVSSVASPGESLTRLIEIADEALLQSKRAGKNQVSENRNLQVN